MKAVILGGTSGMGREIARRLAERGDSVFLLGNDTADLTRSAADLTARHPRNEPAEHALCDLERPEQFAGALDAADEALDGFDTVVVTAAMFASQEALEADVELTRRLVTVNYANTVVFCEHARKRLLERGGGRLTVFSSVAGDRGRKPVAIYGSSKAGIAIYLEALRLGYIETLIVAGALVTNSTCGACAGGHMGVLAAGEVCITSSTRNFKGRMGSPDAEIYMGSSATVAASAIEGYIADPMPYLVAMGDRA